MRDVLIMGAIGLVLYIFFKIVTKEPILPWKEKTTNKEVVPVNKSKRKKKDSNSEMSAKSFRDFLNKLVDIRDNMLVLKGNKYVMITEVIPVNYFLLSPEEQEAIDTRFETWCAQFTYPVGWYFQNRFIDLSDQIETLKNDLYQEKENGLEPLAVEYGESLIEQLQHWQTSQPRYETKRYIVFTYELDAKDIEADNQEEFIDKADTRAFNELLRRVNTAHNALSKADIEVNLLSSEGLVELLYYALNRRKAAKLRFKDIKNQEHFSLYVTADKTDVHIERVKELIQNETA